MKQALDISPVSRRPGTTTTPTLIGHIADDRICLTPDGNGIDQMRSLVRENLRAGFARLRDGYPDLHFESTEGNSNVGNHNYSESIVTGMRAIDGMRVATRGCSIYPFHEDKIAPVNSMSKQVPAPPGSNPVRRARTGPGLNRARGSE